MTDTNNSGQRKGEFGIITGILGGFCHNCGICPYADKRPNSAFW